MTPQHAPTPQHPMTAQRAPMPRHPMTAQHAPTPQHPMTPHHTPTPRPGTLRALTSLRFVAALLVFSWHCVPTRRVSAVFSLGYAGVAFFFLLSGFILTYTYHDAFRDRLCLKAIREFYAARIARVYPLHLATMPLAVASLAYLGANPLWSGVDPATRLRAVAAQAALVQSWIPSRAIFFGANGPAWSISVEAFFYAVFPVVAFGLLRVFGRTSPRLVLTCAGAVCAAQIALLWRQHAVVDDWRWYVFPPSRLVDFVVGMLLAIAFLRVKERVHGALRPASAEMLAVAAVVLAVYVSPFVPLAVRFSAWVLPAWALLIFTFARQRGAVSRMLAHPVLVRLGEVSFAFYLCHLAVITLLGGVADAAIPWFVPLALASTLLASFALHHGIERPMRVRVRALLLARETRACAPAPPPDAPAPAPRAYAAMPSAAAPVRAVGNA